MITLPPASRLFQTNDAYLKMLNATDAGLNFSTTEEVASYIGDGNVTTSSLESSDVISDNSMTVEDWLQNFQFIITLILLVLGLGGNALTLMVTTTRSYRNTAHGLYIIAMAVADITFLLTQPLNTGFVHVIFGRDIRSYSIIGCKIFYFFLQWARPVSALMVALVCFERFVAIWLPLKANVFSSRRAALIEVCGIFSLACFVSGFRTQMVGITDNVCLAVVLTPYNKHLKDFCSIMGITIRILIPTLILLLLTPPTIAKLFHRRLLKRQMNNGRSNQSDETNRVSLMLLSVVIAFCILVTPFCLLKHGYLFIGINIVSSSTPAMRILNEARLICEQINCVINFILYVLISRMFRRQFYEILTCQREQNIGRHRSYRSSSKETMPTVSSMVSKNSRLDQGNDLKRRRSE